VRFQKRIENSGTKFRYTKVNLDILLQNTGATLITDVTDKIQKYKDITFLCLCGKEHTKQFNSIYKGSAMCLDCILSRPPVYYRDAPEHIECTLCKITKSKTEFVHSLTTWKQLITLRCNTCRNHNCKYNQKSTTKKKNELVENSETHKKCHSCLNILEHNEFINDNVRCVRCNDRSARENKKIRESMLLAEQMYPGYKLCHCGNLEPEELFISEITGHIGKICSVCRTKGLEKYDVLREFYVQLKTNKGPCVECGETDVRILEFDHVNPDEKLCCVYRCGSIDSMITESAKCEMRCGRCHIRRSKQQRNYGSASSPGQIYVNNKKIQIGGCVFCTWFDPDLLEALQFDHIDPATKTYNVSALARDGDIAKIDIEIALCRLLCIHCHKLHTIDQRDYYLYRDQPSSKCREERIANRIKVI